MSKKLRVLSLVFVLLLLLPLFPSEVSSTGILTGPIDTSENAILKGTLEDAAEEYVTKFINTSYLYKVEDFSEGTLIEQQARNSAAMPTQINLASGSYTTAELCENIQFFADLAGYYRYVRMANQVVRENFKLTISDFETTISGDTATVKLYTLVTFRYPHLEEDSAIGEYYTVSFAKVDGEWCIADVVSEEMEMLGMNDDTFDIQEEIAVFNEQKAEKEIEYDTASVASSDPEMDAWETMYYGTVTNARGYNENLAVYYAYTYTTTTYTAQEGNNTNFLNSLFYNYTNSGGNCINFANQCIWAGFYGSNDSSSINNKKAPMDSSSWYCTKTASTACWRETGNFWNYVPTCINRAENSTDGIVWECFKADNLNSIRNATPHAEQDQDTSLSLSEMYGAVLLVKNRGHAIVSVRSSFDEIVFCGNSPMRKVATNEDFPNYFSGEFYIIVPKYYQETHTCPGHSYSTVASTGELNAECQNCGYLNLYITPYPDQPIPVGTTRPITGTANRTCFRAAINVSHPDGTSVWYEFTDIQTFTKYYTFASTGLYTIKLVIRDTDDTADSNSHNVSYSYTVRVY